MTTTSHTAPHAPHAPRAASHARPLDAAAQERQRHLNLMGYGDGAIELVAGSNEVSNPDKIALLIWTKATYGTGAPHTRAWVSSDNLPLLDRKAEALAEKWGNVYISAGTYGQAPNTFKDGKLQYTRTAALARRCIVADDVADLDALPLPPTWATETSPGNHQIGYVCDALLTPAQAVKLSRGLAWRIGADPSGTDAQQLIRLAGTLNTKPKCAGRPGNPAEGIAPEGWRVRLRCSGPRYSLERLARALLPGGLADLHHGGAEHQAGTAQGQTEGAAPPGRVAWARLPDGAALMASGRYRYLFAHRPQLAALAMARRVTLMTAGGPDDTDSAQVAVLVSNLVTTGRRNDAGDFVSGLGAPPLAEIRAVALYWRGTLRPGGKLADYQADIDRLLLPDPVGYLPAGYAPETTRGAGAPVSAPALPQLAEAQHKGAGRPAGQRADRAVALATLLADHVGQIVTRGALAALLGLKLRMVAYLLADLITDGRAELRRAGRGLHVVRCAINTPPADGQSVEAEPPAYPVTTPQTDVPPLGSTHPPLSLACPATGAAEAAPVAVADPDDPAAATALDLAALARELVDSYGDAWSRARRAAQKQYGIGGRGDQGRVNELRAAYDVAAAALRAERKAATAARQRREAPARRCRADAQLRHKAEAMSATERRAKMRNLERSMVEDLRLAAKLRAQPYRLDPMTGEPTAERCSDKEPWQFEARAKVWAHQYAIYAIAEERWFFAVFDPEAEAEHLLDLARAELDRARVKAAGGDVTHRPRITLGERPQAEAPPATPGHWLPEGFSVAGMVARLKARAEAGQEAICAD